jgi:hypothetical protein
MHRIEMDWLLIKSETQVWEEIVSKSGHPSWHGRNLDSLSDGWVTGGLDPHGPPYEYIFKNCDHVGDNQRELAIAVMKIAVESIVNNGGTINCS